jgi:thymidylate kinase
MENTLIEFFSALNSEKIEYCLLRGEDELSQGMSFKEVDILVMPGQLSRLSNEASKLGFVSLPAWGHAPHSFYVVFDKESDTWLKIDVVDSLKYGAPVRNLSLDAVTSCLGNRIKNGEVDLISPDDELLTLLLHCLLDKRDIQLKHKHRLVTLKGLITDQTKLEINLSKNIRCYFPESFTWEIICDAIDRKDWLFLLSQSDMIEKHLFRKEPVMSSLRKLKVGLLRYFRPLIFVFFRHGISVALLAPDGAGKSTLAQTLADERVIKARLIYMGSNLDSSNIGLPTTAWLKEKLKSEKTKNRRFSSKLFGAVNFTNRVLEQWLRLSVGMYYKWRGHFIIYDRYVYDTFLAPPAKTFGKRIRRKILSVCPSPTLVLLLDAPGEVLYARKGEHSPDRLEKQRQVFLSLKNHIPNMVVIDATQSAEKVRRQVLDEIWHCYRSTVVGR